MPSFIGIDGEAVDGAYCILQAGNCDPLVSDKVLSTHECLSYIANLPRKCVYVGYSLTYDVENWLRDLDDYQHSLLRAGFLIEHGKYRIRWIRGKIFELRTQTRRVRIYDLYPFFHTSFVRACELVLGERNAFVEEFKRLRSNFTRSMMREIIEYNKTECDLMSRIASRIYEEGCYLGLRTIQLYGPSAFSQILLRKCGVTRTDDEPFLKAYYGGRFETFRFGKIVPVDNYDINSAYPYATQNLLDHDGLRHVNDYEGVGIYRVRWMANNDFFGPYPYRTRDRLLIYPKRGEAWLWSHEIEAGKRYCSDLRVIEGYALINPKPFKSIYNALSRAYGMRRRFRGTFRDYMLKILMNSVYGKLAQTVGNGRVRRLDFASFITAHTRAYMLDLCWNRLDKLIAIYTDGVYFRDVAIKNGDSEGLGKLKHERYSQGIFLGNGIYILERDGHRKCRARGFKRFDADKVLHDLRESGRATLTETIFVGRGMTRIEELRDKYLTFAEYSKTLSLEANRQKRAFDIINLDCESVTYALEGYDEPSFEMVLDSETMVEYAMGAEALFEAL